MIRRGLWLLAGAAGGIMGYRRVSALGRQVTRTLSPGTDTIGGAGPRANLARRRRPARATLRFARDVRQGMELYFDRQQARSAPTLGAGAPALDHPDHGKPDQREDH